jgi:hypothetical protein
MSYKPRDMSFELQHELRGYLKLRLHRLIKYDCPSTVAVAYHQQPCKRDFLAHNTENVVCRQVQFNTCLDAEAGFMLLIWRYLF